MKGQVLAESQWNALLSFWTETLSDASRRTASGFLVGRLLAHGIQILLFRRTLLCVMQDSFKLLPEVTQNDVIYDLHPKAVTELWLLSLLAPPQG